MKRVLAALALCSSLAVAESCPIDILRAQGKTNGLEAIYLDFRVKNVTDKVIDALRFLVYYVDGFDDWRMAGGFANFEDTKIKPGQEKNLGRPYQEELYHAKGWLALVQKVHFTDGSSFEFPYTRGVSGCFADHYLNKTRVHLVTLPVGLLIP